MLTCFTPPDHYMGWIGFAPMLPVLETDVFWHCSTHEDGKSRNRTHNKRVTVSRFTINLFPRNESQKSSDELTFFLK